LMEEILHHLGCINPVNNEINMLVSRIPEPSTVSHVLLLFLPSIAFLPPGKIQGDPRCFRNGHGSKTRLGPICGSGCLRLPSSGDGRSIRGQAYTAYMPTPNATGFFSGS